MTSTLTIVRQRRKRRDQSRRSARQGSQRFGFSLAFLFSAAGLVAILVLALTYASLTRGLPSTDELNVLLDPQHGLLLQPTRLYDRSGQYLLAVLAPQDAPRTYLTYEQLPENVVQATLAVVEPDFWTSPGYELSGWRTPAEHPTLAQSLAYDLLLWDQPASARRAIHERMLGAQLTARYGRAQVLEWYLNSLDYGQHAYGVEAASRLYFDKPASELTLSEAAMIAAAGLAPELNPFDAPQAAEARRVEVLLAMLGSGDLEEGQAMQAIMAPPALAAAPQPDAGPAPDFVRLVLDQLGSVFGPGRVERGGMLIITSLDFALQMQTACALQAEQARLTGLRAEAVMALTAPDGSLCETARLLPARDPAAEQTLARVEGTALVIDPASGQVLAAAGDLSAQPAGTSLTPFLYLTAFARGFNPASLIWDIPSGTPVPGREYHGPLRLRTALANDYLTPAETLLAQLGPESVQTGAASFGLRLSAGSGLLGQATLVSPLELAGAYAIFAANGVQVGQELGGSLQPVSVLQVTGFDHSLWLDWTSPQTRAVIGPQLAYLMNHVLSDESARWPSLGHPNPLEIGRPAGVKLSASLTGDGAWTVGYTPQRVVAVRLGGAQGEPLSAADSAELWHALAQFSVRSLPALGWDMPAGVSSLQVCDPSGLLPTQACPNIVNEVFLEGRQPVQADSLYQTFQVNRETGLLATIFTPPELVEARVYLVPPAEARAWAGSAGLAVPPEAYDTIQIPAPSLFAHITAPAMFSDGRGQIELRGSAAGADFDFYRLEYGQGLYPRRWVQIGENVETPVVEGLLGSWDTDGLNGLYALRLMVVYTDRRVEQAVLQVTLDNTPPQVAISYPAPGEELDLAEAGQIALQAQVDDPFLTQVEFFVDGTSLGTLESGPYGVLWEAAPGEHRLRVVAADRAGNRAEAEIEFTVRR
jgi:membrane peptidoglycan carboxypeptidase